MDDDQNQLIDRTAEGSPESQPQSTVVTPRHPPGRGSQVSPAERMEIQRAFLTQNGATISGLAEQFGRTRETIAACLKGRDFQELREQVRSESIEEARAHLRRNTMKAARHWTDDALEIAAKKGDHKPAKDLLTATGVIESDEKAPQIQVLFGLELKGGPEGDDRAPGQAMAEGSPRDERLDLAEEQLSDLGRRLADGSVDPTETQQLLDQIQGLLRNDSAIRQAQQG